MTTITVITPAFNAGNYLMSTIDSVVKQDMEHIEMIIVDDNSTDNTSEIITEAKKKHSFITTFRNKKNMGPAFCRNLAIRKSKGEYIAFLDADDLWLPCKLHIQISYMKEHKIDFSYTSYFTIDQNNKSNGKINIGQHNLNYQRLLFNCPIGCLTVIYKKANFMPTYMPNIKRGQDYGFWLKLFKQNPRIAYIDEPLAMYRKSTNSISADKKKKIANMFVLYNKHLKINTFFSCIYIASHSIHSFLKARGLTHTRSLKSQKTIEPHQTL